MIQSSQIWAPGRYHWQDTDKAVEEVRRHLAEIGEAETTVLAGFSMGAGLAIRLALSRLLPAKGFLAVAPSFRMEQMMPLIDSAPPGLKGYIVVGTEDWVYGAATQLTEALQKAGLGCSVEEHRGLDHDYPVDFAASLQRGLDFLQS